MLGQWWGLGFAGCWRCGFGLGVELVEDIWWWSCLVSLVLLVRLCVCTVKVVEIVLIGIGRGGLDLFFRLVCHDCSSVCSFEDVFSRACRGCGESGRQRESGEQ